MLRSFGYRNGVHKLPGSCTASGVPGTGRGRPLVLLVGAGQVADRPQRDREPADLPDLGPVPADRHPAPSATRHRRGWKISPRSRALRRPEPCCVGAVGDVRVRQQLVAPHHQDEVADPQPDTCSDSPTGSVDDARPDDDQRQPAGVPRLPADALLVHLLYVYVAGAGAGPGGRSRPEPPPDGRPSAPYTPSELTRTNRRTPVRRAAAIRLRVATTFPRNRTAVVFHLGRDVIDRVTPVQGRGRRRRRRRGSRGPGRGGSRSRRRASASACCRCGRKLSATSAPRASRSATTRLPRNSGRAGDECLTPSPAPRGAPGRARRPGHASKMSSMMTVTRRTSSGGAGTRARLDRPVKRPEQPIHAGKELEVPAEQPPEVAAQRLAGLGEVPQRHLEFAERPRRSGGTTGASGRPDRPRRSPASCTPAPPAGLAGGAAEQDARGRLAAAQQHPQFARHPTGGAEPHGPYLRPLVRNEVGDPHTAWEMLFWNSPPGSRWTQCPGSPASTSPERAGQIVPEDGVDVDHARGRRRTRSWSSTQHGSNCWSCPAQTRRFAARAAARIASASVASMANGFST